MSEKFYYFKIKHMPLPKKIHLVRFKTARKIHENIQNSVSSLYWWSVQDP